MPTYRLLITFPRYMVYPSGQCQPTSLLGVASEMAQRMYLDFILRRPPCYILNRDLLSKYPRVDQCLRSRVAVHPFFKFQRGSKQNQPVNIGRCNNWETHVEFLPQKQPKKTKYKHLGSKLAGQHTTKIICHLRKIAKLSLT